MAIEDLSFFLPEGHDNSDPKPVSKPYRLFEQKWREVSLFWLEQRSDNTEIFQKLDAFRDGCGGFYECMILFLRESMSCTKPNRLVTHIDERIRDNEEIKKLIEACEYITPDDDWNDDEEASYDDSELTSYQDSKSCEDYEESYEVYLNSREHEESMERAMDQQMQYYDDIENEILQSFDEWLDRESKSSLIKEDQEEILVQNLAITINKIIDHSGFWLIQGSIQLNRFFKEDGKLSRMLILAVKRSMTKPKFSDDKETWIFNYTDILCHCIQHTSYQEFYQAWHSPSSNQFEISNQAIQEMA